MAVDKKPRDKHQSKKPCGKIMQEPNSIYSLLLNADIIPLPSVSFSLISWVIVSSICLFSYKRLSIAFLFISQHI